MSNEHTLASSAHLLGTLSISHSKQEVPSLRDEDVKPDKQIKRVTYIINHHV